MATRSKDADDGSAFRRAQDVYDEAIKEKKAGNREEACKLGLEATNILLSASEQTDTGARISLLFRVFNGPPDVVGYDYDEATAKRVSARVNRFHGAHPGFDVSMAAASPGGSDDPPRGTARDGDDKVHDTLPGDTVAGPLIPPPSIRGEQVVPNPTTSATDNGSDADPDIKALKKSIEKRVGQVPIDDPTLLNDRQRLAQLLNRQGDYAGARAQFELILAAYAQEKHTSNDPEYRETQLDLAETKWKLGQLDPSSDLYQDVIDRDKKRHASGSGASEAFEVSGTSIEAASRNSGSDGRETPAQDSIASEKHSHSDSSVPPAAGATASGGKTDGTPDDLSQEKIDKDRTPRPTPAGSATTTSAQGGGGNSTGQPPDDSQDVIDKDKRSSSGSSASPNGAAAPIGTPTRQDNESDAADALELKGMAAMDSGDDAQAQRFFEDTLDLRKKQKHSDPAAITTTEGHLTEVLGRRQDAASKRMKDNDLDEASMLERDIIEGFKKLPSDLPGSLRAKAGQASLYQRQCDLSAALALRIEIVDIMRRAVSSPEHQAEFSEATRELAALLRVMGRTDEARALER